MGNVKCANCVGLIAQDDLRLSPSEYAEAQVSARRTGVTSLNIQGTGANPGHRAEIVPSFVEGHPSSLHSTEDAVNPFTDFECNPNASWSGK